MLLFQKYFPKHLSAKLTALLANTRSKFVKNALINLYMNRYNVNIDEAEFSDINAYQTFNAFFTRHLKSGIRTIDQDPHAIISPVDGTIYHFGKMGNEQLFHVKGFDFNLSELLAGKQDIVTLLEQGECICMYLAPQDYHRVHMPISGVLKKMIYVPGTLYSVSPQIIATIPKVFARNERLICVFETALGPMVMILVGATNVGSLHTTWAGQINPNYPQSIKEVDYTNETIQLNKGDEMGYFQAGSTVIVLFPKEVIRWSDELKSNEHMKYGKKIGLII